MLPSSGSSVVSSVTGSGSERCNITGSGSVVVSGSAFLPIFFEFDEFQLSYNKGKLEELVHYLKLKPNLKVEIQGHTDERGTNDKNMALAEKRAKVVYNFLLLSGVNKNQLSFIAYGEKAPLCQEQNEKCWNQNNRVHFIITENV